MAHAHAGGGHAHGQGSSAVRLGRWLRPYWWGGGGGSYDPDLISSLQACLAQSVAPWVPRNGQLGRATRHALRTFQAQQGLPASGLPDQDTVAQLRISCAGHPPAGDDSDAPSSTSPAGSPATGELSALPPAREGHAQPPFRPGPSDAAHGRWFRHQNRIVLLLNHSPAREDQEVPSPPAGASDPDLAAVQSAMQRGLHDENRLTDIVFNRRHPERRGQPLLPGERDLIREWLLIRSQMIRPELHSAPAGAAAASPSAQPAAQPPAQPSSTTSGVEAAGNTTHIIECLRGLRDQGRSVSFVQRYLRDLTRAEVAALKNAGFRIVSCFEEGSPTHIAYFTRAQGQHDARRAFTQAQAVGQPAGTPVYFAIDADPDARQKQPILDYLQGVSDGFAQYLADMQARRQQPVPYAIGVYGSGCVLTWCQAQGIATWFWQAFAPGWCDNRHVWPGANIHTSGRDIPERCGWRLGHLEGWGNEGAW